MNRVEISAQAFRIACGIQAARAIRCAMLEGDDDARDWLDALWYVLGHLADDATALQALPDGKEGAE